MKFIAIFLTFLSFNLIAFNDAVNYISDNKIIKAVAIYKKNELNLTFFNKSNKCVISKTYDKKLNIEEIKKEFKDLNLENLNSLKMGMINSSNEISEFGEIKEKNLIRDRVITRVVIARCYESFSEYTVLFYNKNDQLLETRIIFNKNYSKEEVLYRKSFNKQDLQKYFPELDLQNLNKIHQSTPGFIYYPQCMIYGMVKTSALSLGLSISFILGKFSNELQSKFNSKYLKSLIF